MRSFTQQEARESFKIARRVLKHPGFDILIAPRAKECGRLLVITPGRIGNAVQRNKIRRRLKMIFHEGHLSDRPFDWIIVVHKEALGMSYDQLKEIIMSTSSNLPA